MSDQDTAPDEGLVAMDVSDPLDPLYLGIYPTEVVSPTIVLAEKTLLYFANWNTQDFSIIDFSDPAHPNRAGGTNLPVYWTDASLTDDYIILTGEGSGGSVYFFTKSSSLEGRITDHNYQPIAGVSLALSAGVSTLSEAQGLYAFDNLDFGSYVVTPTIPGYAFFPAYREATLPGDSTGQDFVMLASPVSTTLAAGITTTLTYTDVQGLPTSFIFPPGVVPIIGTATVTPTMADEYFGTNFAGHVFELAVTLSPTDTRSLAYPVPVAVNIQYSDLDAAVITDTARLALYRLEQMAWVEADAGCPAGATPPILEPGVFQTAICQDGRYALFGPTHGIALPRVYYGSDASDFPPSP